MREPKPAHEAFRRALPYEIMPTRLPGVYTSPALPADFDPNADSRTLLKQGVLWRRPTAADRPTVRAVWDKFASRKWDPKKHIIPRMEVHLGKTHRVQGLQKAGTGYTGPNWSGSVIQGSAGSFTSAIGTWVVPTVGIPPEPPGLDGGWDSFSWVGIDGFYTTNDVLQAGVQQSVDANGNATYLAWYEWFVAGADPNQFPYIYEVVIPNFTVSPGDTVYCSVQYVGNNTAGYLYFADDTTGENFSITLAPPTGASFNGSDAEWIMEAPGIDGAYASLPAFSPVQFTGALACGGSAGITGPQNGDYVNIIGSSGAQLTEVTLGTDAATIYFIG
jgi:hypothetical protein